MGIEDREEGQQEELSLRDQLEAAFDGNEEAPIGDDVTGEEQGTGEQEGGEGEGQPRDERGRWTKAQQEHYEAQQRQQQEQQEQQQEPQEQQLVLAPPHGWPPAAKAAYAKLPPEVQHAVAQRELEVNKGFAKLRDFKGLEPHAEEARASGTTLKEAFDRYRAAEQRLDDNFGEGVLALCEMYEFHPLKLAGGILSQFGMDIRQLMRGGQPTEGMPSQVPPQIGLLARELAATKEQLRALATAQERREQEAINGQIAQFAQEATYFEDVREDMAHLISTGKADSLEQAYDMACWMNPQVRDLLIKEQAAPQQNGDRVSKARRASGSLPTGAPAGTKPQGGSSTGNLRSDLESAWDQAS